MSSGVIITVVICITVFSMFVVTTVCDTIREIEINKIENEEDENGY